VRAFFVFWRKELLESLRTGKLAIMLAVFALLGVLSPLLALLTPAIVGNLDLGGVVIELPEPTAMDSWAQFFKNVGQMGMLTVVIIFSGLMAGELSRGTLVNLLTKGLGRDVVIWAKFAAATVVWTLAYLLALAITAAYTAWYWGLDLHNPLAAFAGLWLFGELLVALQILGGTLTASHYGSLALSAGVVVALSLLSIAPASAAYNPLSLTGATLALLSGDKDAADFAWALALTAAATALLLAASVAAFRRRRL